VVEHGLRRTGARLALFGLTFKAGTDDLRDSPALAVAALLRAEGAALVGYDPAVPGLIPSMINGIEIAADAHTAAQGATALVVLTEWPEFRTLDWNRLAQLVDHRTIIDTRNLLDPDVLTRNGFTYHGIGTRPRIPNPTAILTNDTTTPNDPNLVSA
jgi:UDPglucose 6-dehydrogenase